MTNYLNGLGNYHQSEAIPDTLPKNQNSPQVNPKNLYTEQISGSAFTAPKAEKKYSWLYKTKPSVGHSEFTEYAQPKLLSTPFNNIIPPTQLRWNRFEKLNKKIDFIDSLFTLMGHAGAAIHIYQASQSMENKVFYSSDGEFLIVPIEGELEIFTEMGILKIKPNDMAVIPRGIKFKVNIKDYAFGYICENYGRPFELPELGPIGANGLAYPRHFDIPVAHYEKNNNKNYKIINKFNGNLWQAETNNTPFDVIAWHGNYVPYKYSLELFNAINSVSFDHTDPSIFTVLTSQSDRLGTANVDFVIFPPRWLVAEHTFRPPYYHRNIMSEFMGLIQGVYDAKPDGFKPGGCTLHNCMTPHGPDNQAYQKAINKELKPEKYKNTLAFMFESQHIWVPTQQALDAVNLDKNYLACWQKN